mgnify:CR=1 FL=1
MIKDILQQLAPLDEKIAALRGDPADENMTDITNHAAELAELSAQEDALLSGCGGADRRGQGLSGTPPGAPSHRRDRGCTVHRRFLSSAATVSARKMPPFWAVWRCSTASRSRSSATARASTLEENLRCNFGMPRARRGYRKGPCA